MRIVKSRPRLGSALRAGLLALICLWGSASTACAAAQAEVNAAVGNGFARLVFTLPPDVEAEVRQANGIVIVGFKQPVEIAIDHLAVAVRDYVSVARRDPDGMAVRIALAQKVTVNTMAAGEKLFVDLLPAGWTGLPPGLPQEVVDELSRRAREAEKRARQEQSRTAGAPAREPVPVRVRVATLPTLTRHTYALPGEVEITTERNREQFTLVFGASLKFDLADVRSALPAMIAGVETETKPDSTTVRYAFAGKADVRTFREEGTFVVDVSPVGATAAAPPVPAPAPPAPAPQQQQQQQQQAGGGAPPPPEPASPPPPAPAPRQPASAPAPAQAAIITPLFRREAGGLRMIFPFREQTSAAVFTRGDALWLVFDSAVPIDAKSLKDDPSKSIRSVSVATVGTAQVVRLGLDRRRLTSVAPNDLAWVVTLGDVALQPTQPLTLTRGRIGRAQTTAAIAFAEPQQVHRIADAEGAPLVVVTAFGPTRGFLKDQDLLEFRILASVHGVAIEPLADDIFVQATAERITINRPAGLALSQVGTGGATLPGYQLAPLDVRSWGFDREAKFQERQAALMQAAAAAPDGKRTPARLDYARFFMARDMFAEAKGALDVALAAEHGSELLSTAHVLRAIANVMLGREEQALRDLASPTVGNQHDAPLWRSVALSRLGRFAEAREGFQSVDAAVAELPVELQRVALQETARCALELGDLGEALRRLNELESIGIPFELRPGVSLLSGRLAERLRRPDDALAAYRAAAESRVAPVAAQARLRIIALRRAQGQIEREDEIAELEQLTAAWRGDDTEVEAMQLLTRAYSENGRFRDAFQIMRTALSVHPRSQITRDMQDEAAAIFDGIFLGDRGDKLTPVEALGLFYDFRNLTPVGRRGDEMIRRLVERLVAMDLLTQAAELLQHQIDHRLQGAARAQVATRLATIYLMNRKPGRALAVLHATRMSDLPQERRHQRLLLEARALSDSGRHNLALELIENMEGREVARLRADVHWAARQWLEAAEEIERMYGERWREPPALETVERSDVLRAAVGYALADDALGLDRFRDKYAGKMAAGPDARLFQVVTAPLEARTLEFAAIAKAATSVDTLTAFLRDLRARYPERSGVMSAAPQGERRS